MSRTFDMKLCKEPFDTIRNGAKTIEYRLNDEKRYGVMGIKIKLVSNMD